MQRTFIFLPVKQILDDVLDLWWRLKEIACAKLLAPFLSFNNVIYYDFSLILWNGRCCPKKHQLSI